MPIVKLNMTIKFLHLGNLRRSCREIHTIRSNDTKLKKITKKGFNYEK